jgi:hypothetical protein
VHVSLERIGLGVDLFDLSRVGRKFERAFDVIDPDDRARCRCPNRRKIFFKNTQKKIAMVAGKKLGSGRVLRLAYIKIYRPSRRSEARGPGGLRRPYSEGRGRVQAISVRASMR